MMKVLIKNVSPWLVDESIAPPAVYNFRGEFILENGQEIRIFDIDDDLRDFVGKEAELLLFTEEAVKRETYHTIKGKFIRNYKLDPKKQQNL